MPDEPGAQEPPPTIRIPRHFAPDGLLCLNPRGRPRTKTRATCIVCWSDVILAVIPR